MFCIKWDGYLTLGIMKRSFVRLLTLCLTLSACDPAATTGLLLRPVANTTGAPREMDTSSLVDMISGVLRENGFEKLTYQPDKTLGDIPKERIAECGHPYYWLSQLRQSAPITNVNVCISGGTVRISLSDMLQFTLSEQTKMLRESLIKSLAEKLPDMKVSIE